MIITLKKCTKCKIEKPESKFSFDRKTLDGLNKQCRNCKKEYDNKRRQLKRDQEYEQKYNMYPGQYNVMLKSQNGKCLICRQEETLEVDHCHKTNKVRGLLCHKCNTGLGHFNDNPELLKIAIKYLEENH